MTMAPYASDSTRATDPLKYSTRITDVILQYNPVEGSAPEDGIVLNKIIAIDTDGETELLESTIYEIENRQLVKPGKNYTLQYYHFH